MRQEMEARQLAAELPPPPVQVRVFTDTAAGDAEPPTDVEALLACEERAGRTDPHRQVAALLHVIARRPARGKHG